MSAELTEAQAAERASVSEATMAAVIDPVCGMRIESDEAAGQSMYQKVTYAFVSVGCLDRFIAQPQQFVETAQD